MIIIMRVLELFSGTGSVGSKCKEIGWEVISLDLKNADINIDILKWDYKNYPKGYFDIIWASPPCDTFSKLRDTWIGRKLKKHGDTTITKEIIIEDMMKEGLPILNKTKEIINYFNPSYWFMENPQTGRMKEFNKELPFYDVDYCKYSDWGYRKRTRIWTNVKNFNAKLCCKDCDSFVNGRHNIQLGVKTYGVNTDEKYRIPPLLIEELFECIIKNI
jgi:site-specific DNA-cytosine methylase